MRTIEKQGDIILFTSDTNDRNVQSQFSSHFSVHGSWESFRQSESESISKVTHELINVYGHI